MNAKSTVFVNLPHPNPVPTYEAGLRQWKAAAVGFAKDLTPAMKPAPAVASTEEPTKMPPEQHQDDRFLTGIKATLKISGKWLTAPVVFSQYYDKYNLVDLRDIEIGLDGLAKAGEIQAKVIEGGKQYFLPTTDFERLLNRCQVSKYHLAEITGIDEGVMCGYCKGAEIDTADAQKIADKLNLELSELEVWLSNRRPQRSRNSLKKHCPCISRAAVGDAISLPVPRLVFPMARFFNITILVRTFGISTN